MLSLSSNRMVGGMWGRAKTSARRGCCYVSVTIRAGFEPRPRIRPSLRIRANLAVFNDRRWAESRPRRGSNPARTEPATERNLGRAEIFALPILKFRFTFLQEGCHSFFLVFECER